MKKRRICTQLLCIVVLFMMTATVWGQTKSVSGTVKDPKGEAVIGASVVVKGSTTGTITDVNGGFTLQVPSTAKSLIVSFIGMETQDVAITGKPVAVTLNESSVTLNEVVAVGYGTVKKSDLTGAVSSVNAGKITEAGRTSVLSSIQGSIPGVQIQQSSSRTGAGFNIVVRGQNSISGNTEPLYVVDGVITSSIDFLNPQDIDKIDVLKDASSTAIYGSRGSNGVVIVQTKSGQSVKQTSKTEISYDGYYGFTNKSRMPDFMDSKTWMNFRAISLNVYNDNNNDGVIDVVPTTGSTYYPMIWGGAGTLNASGQPFYPNGTFSGSQFLLDRYQKNISTNWIDLVTKTGQQQNHYINVSGSTKDISYVIGMGYQDEKGIFTNDDYTRYNLKGSLTATLNKHWSTGFNINTAYSNQELGSSNAITNGFSMSPIVSPYADNLSSSLNTIVGNYVLIPGKSTENVKDAAGNALYANSLGGGGFTSTYNPLVDLTSTSNNIKKYAILGNAYLQYSPIKDLSIKTTFEPNFVAYRNGLYESSYSQDRAGAVPLATAESNFAFNYTWDNQINYKFSLNQDHALDVMGLYSVYEGNTEDYYTKTTGYSWDYDWYNLGAATNSQAGSPKMTSNYTKYSMLSAAVRANYSYKGKYLVTASFRTDGSSKLAQGHKWATFPSAAIGWRMTEESFMNPYKGWLSNLKLRASLGFTGNNNINPYQTQSVGNTATYYNFGTTTALGTAIGSPASTELTWEKTRELDLGFDFGILNNRINGSVDVYDRLSSGILQSVTLPYESGAGTITENIGKISNRGIEAALNAIVINNSDFNWSVNATFATNKNKIVNLFGHTDNGYTYINSGTQKWIVGENISSIYGYVFDGIWTAEDIKAAVAAKNPLAVTSSGVVIAREGQAKVKDLNGNKAIDAGDRKVQGHSTPTWTGGLGTSLSYKGFDFNVNLYVAQGMTVFSPFMEQFTNLNDRGRNKLNVDYYIPAGTYLITNDGSFSQATTSHNSQTYPSPDNVGNYWHVSGSDGNRELPGAWVNASYVKVRNITLGYTLPKTIDKVLGIQSLRVYCNVLNPFVITSGYKGFDPEWAGASMGKDNGPSTITCQLGVNLKF